MGSSVIMVPPVHDVVDVVWFDEAPVEVGFYWFLGECSMGSMGGHYNGSVEPLVKLYLVEVKRLVNGLIAVTNGHFMSLREWDIEGRGEGWLGRWAQAVVPKVVC